MLSFKYLIAALTVIETAAASNIAVIAAIEEVKNLGKEKREIIYSFHRGRREDFIGLEAADLEVAKKYFGSLFASSESEISQSRDPERSRNELAAFKARFDAGIQKTEADAAEVAAAEAAGTYTPRQIEKACDDYNYFSLRYLPAELKDSLDAALEDVMKLQGEKRDKIFSFREGDSDEYLSGLGAADLIVAEKYFETRNSPVRKFALSRVFRKRET